MVVQEHRNPAAGNVKMLVRPRAREGAICDVRRQLVGKFKDRNDRALGLFARAIVGFIHLLWRYLRQFLACRRIVLNRNVPRKTVLDLRESSFLHCQAEELEQGSRMNDAGFEHRICDGCDVAMKHWFALNEHLHSAW